jgi:hypothetical protein
MTTVLGTVNAASKISTFDRVSARSVRTLLDPFCTLNFR